jgi:hypothetical protein
MPHRIAFGDMRSSPGQRRAVGSRRIVPPTWSRKGSLGFQGSLPDASIGRLSPDFDFHSRLSAHAMHDISSNLAGRRRVCLLHYSQRAIAGHAH